MNKIWLLFAIAIVGGVGIGQAFWQGQLRSKADSLPTDWSREPHTIKVKLASLQGDLPLHDGQLSLDFYRGILHATCSSPEELGGCQLQKPAQQLSVQATLPIDAQLEVWLSAPPKCAFQPGQKQANSPLCQQTHGLGVVIDNIGEPSTVAMQYHTDGPKELTCSPSLPPPSEANEPQSLSLQYKNRKLLVEFNGQQSVCNGQLGTLPPMIRPGIREVHLSDLTVDNKTVAIQSPTPKWILWIIGAIAMLGIIFAELKTKANRTLMVLTTLPVLSAWWLSTLDLRIWVEALRASWMPWRWVPLLFPLLSIGFLKAIHHCGRYTRGTTRPQLPVGYALLIVNGLIVQLTPVLGAFWERILAFLIVAGAPVVLSKLASFNRTNNQERLLTAQAVMGTIATGGFLAVDPLHIWGVVWLYIGSCSVVVLIWANMNARLIRFYNLTCLISCILAIVSVEGALRGTKAGLQWSNRGALTETNDAFGCTTQTKQRSV